METTKIHQKYQYTVCYSIINVLSQPSFQAAKIMRESTTHHNTQKYTHTHTHTASHKNAEATLVNKQLCSCIQSYNYYREGEATESLSHPSQR